MAAAAAAASTPAPWRVLTEFGYFVALCAALGATLGYLLVVRPALRAARTDTETGPVRQRASVLLAWSGVLLVLGGYAQLAGRVARADSPVSSGPALAPSRIAAFLGVPAKSGTWISSGHLILAQNLCFAVAAVLLLALFIPAMRTRLGLIAAIAAPVAVLGTVVNSVPTDFAAETTDSTLDTIATQLHILAGCTWLGGLATLTLLARVRRTVDERAGLLFARIWQRFSAVALVSVGAVLTSGAWLAWRHVGDVTQLFTTTYGRFLLVKLLLVAVLVAAGAYNQFVLTPKVTRALRAGDHRRGFSLTLRHFPGVVAVEAVLGAGVLLIVPFLSGSARKQAGDLGSPDFDAGILAIGVVLVAGLAASLYTTHRVSSLLARQS
jgi:putative copper export protein